MGYIDAANNICLPPSILEQSCLKIRAFMLNADPPTRKKVGYLAQNGYSMSFKVICFDVDEKSLWDYIL